jgi:hypothetical protein
MTQMKNIFAVRWGIIVVGAFIGVFAALLQKMGNPGNMGICVACFDRDIAGALGLHRADVVQYMRPEIIGFVLGSLVAAYLFKEFRPRAGSAPIVLFVLGAFAMIGALVFLGCPWRALLRLAGGDGNAILGIAGLIGGIWVGTLFLKGPGSMHAPLAVSLLVGLAVGFLAQRSRFCTMGAFRDLILFRQPHLFTGLLSLLVFAFVTNLILGQFHPGFAKQPVAHTLSAWNFGGMVLAGLAFALAGGCPGRQLFLAGEGDGDAAIFVLGMIVGAGFAHNFGTASSPAGVGPNGIAAVIIGLLVCLFIGFIMRRKMT